MSTLHVIGLPWTTTTPEYLTCAYTQKILKFGDMMTGRSRRVILYTGGEANTARCDEHVPCLWDHERERFFGPWTPEMVTQGSITWDAEHPAWALFNARAIAEIQERIQPQDLILLTGGNCQRRIATAFPHPQHTVAEWAVGYEGIFTDYCAFESQAWMHHVYGLNGWRYGRAYDAVIPNFFDPADFALAEKPGYLVFLGRLVASKGVHVAWQIAQAAGRPLIVAGPGGVTTSHDGVTTIAIEGLDPLVGAELGYVGPVNPAARAALLAGADAVLMPTQYLEPFGGVAVEAMLSGTPVIASDWGAFTETVTPDVGRRFRTLAEGVRAVDEVAGLDPEAIRASACRRFGLEAVAPQFDRWFDQLDGLWGDGWSALPSLTTKPADKTAQVCTL